MTKDDNDNNSKVTIILAIGLIGVAIGLLYLLKINMNTNTTPTLSTLQTQEPTQLEALYMQRLESILNEKGLSNTNEIDVTNTLSATIPRLHL